MVWVGSKNEPQQVGDLGVRLGACSRSWVRGCWAWVVGAFVGFRTCFVSGSGLIRSRVRRNTFRRLTEGDEGLAPQSPRSRYGKKQS